MPPKRPSAASAASTPSAHKLPKTEYFGPDDFSNSVKKKLSNSTRTGQACDRCKVRKIRCDGLLSGCSPCIQNNTECRTTDRITGRATSRGYVENLEQRARDMEARIRELEARLSTSGIDPKSSNGYAEQGSDWTSTINGHAPMWSTASSGGTHAGYNSHSPDAATPQGHETNNFRTLPAFRAGCTGDNYLGVSAGNSRLSSIRGTSLSVLGMEIDIADFTSADMDEPPPGSSSTGLYNKSYQAFLQSALNINPKLPKVDLPDRELGMTYIDWYFRVINPYLPALHKPTVVALATRMYDDPSFQPTTAETVMVHMVLAIMYFQYAARNYADAEQQTHLCTQSNRHYHYALGMFYQLVQSRTLQDLQALTMICAHLRNFPKPGASWMLTQTTFTLAIEMGLHRSAKRWNRESPYNVLEIEMRKRTFWCLVVIHVALSGKLGRPMPFRIEDIDVEFPIAVDDELLSEKGIDSSRTGKCSFSFGIAAFRLQPLFLELFSTLYAVRRNPSTYLETVTRLESKIQRWREELPAETSLDSTTNNQEDRVFTLWTHMMYLEFRILLRHPSVSMTDDARFNAESMGVCVECSRQMLRNVRDLQKYKSLDTTWYNSTTYVMAITMTLFSQWERRSEMSSADLQSLKEEMDLWLDIMGDVGSLLGSGTRLREAVRVVSDSTLGLLSKSLAHKSSFSSQGGQGPNRSPSRSPHRRTSSGGAFSSQNFSNSYQPAAPASGASASNNGYLSANQGSVASHPYSSTGQYPYPEPSASGPIPYPTSQAVSFDTSSYPNGDQVPPLSGSTSAQHVTQPLMYSSTPAPSANSLGWSGSNSVAWHRWTTNMTGNLEPQECYSASALMQLGQRDISAPEATQAPVADMGVSMAESMNHGATWPLMIFDMSQQNTA